MQDAPPWGSAFFYGGNPWIIKYSQKIFRQTKYDILENYNKKELCSVQMKMLYLKKTKRDINGKK